MIAISQLLLTFAVLCWALLVVVRRERVEAPRFFWQLAAYAGVLLMAGLLPVVGAWRLRRMGYL